MGKSLKRFSDFKVRSKLTALTFMLIASLVFMAIATKLMFNSTKTLTILANEERIFSENFKSGIDEFYHFELSGNTEDLNKALTHLAKANEMSFAFARIDSVMNFMPREEWILFLYSAFKEGFNGNIQLAEYMGDQVNLFSKLNKKRLNEIKKMSWDAYLLGENIISKIENYNEGNTAEKFIALQAEFEKVHLLTKTISTKLYLLNEYVNKTLNFLLIFLVILLGAVTFWITTKISKSISKPINKLTDNFKQIASGNLTTSINIDTKNEIGDLSKAFSKIQVGLLDIISYSKKVAKGDYSAKLKPKSDADELSLALNKMAAELEQTKKQTDKENWLQNGLSGLDDQMRGNSTVREMSDNIIEYLCNLLEIEIGAVYVFDEVLEHLEFTGSIGLIKKNIKEIILPGEGLIGKAALQNSIQIIHTKNKYHKTYSASGELYPEKLYLVPLHFDKRIQAVIELAPLNDLSELKIEFLNLVANRISVNLSASVARFRHKELLDKSLEQANILRAHEEELNKNLKENKKIQAELVREKSSTDSLLNNIPDTIYFKDLNSKFLKVSKSMLPKFKAAGKENYIGLTDFDIQDPEHAKLAFDVEQDIIKTGKPKIGLLEKHINNDGSHRYVLSTKMPYFDENGKILGTFGISKDVTELKKLEIEIQEQNDKLQIQQEELRATNEELKSQEEELRVANEELAEQTKILSESEKSLQVQQEELRVANEELEFKTNEITVKNENLVKTQKELKHKAKELELASQYKSEFLANMSHELRTPLNSMLILSKLLGNNKVGNLNTDQIKSANIIHKSGNDLLNLINEILDLSKIEAGKMTYDFTNFSTEEIQTEIIHIFKPVAENKGLNLEINQSDNFPQIINTDKQRLMQIIKNLLSNAFKFTSSGNIKVVMGIPPAETKFINPGLNNKNTYFISVQDSGVGIHQTKVDEIFEAFQQADGSTSRKFGGTGLGLSISKQLTRVLGGEIHVDSTEGIGSVFTVYLPLKQENGEAKNDDVVEEKNASKKLDKQTEKVNNGFVEKPIEVEIPVFIDDDRNSELNRLMVLIIHSEKEKADKLLDQCHKRKFNAVAAINITDGIKLSEKYSPKAIIISADLNDPKEFKKLKENKHTNRLPVHLVSRIEDSTLEDLEELKTPESKEFKNGTKNIESKLNTEYNQILVVEDDPATLKAVHMLLENIDIIIHEAKTGQQAYDLISIKNFDCIILDLRLPDFSGHELLKRLNSEKIPIPNVIIHTARKLSKKELRELRKYSDSIVIKGVKSDERLMDEVSLFLHQVANTLPNKSFSPSSDDTDNLGYKGKKVLLVDDDIRNIFALAQILEEKEFEILEAENGEIAVEVLKNNPDTDLVLMDIMMPVMDGYKAMKIIRGTPGIDKIPIITLTAKAMKEDYQKSIDSGANDYISKPVDIDKLFELLKIWLFK